MSRAQHLVELWRGDLLESSHHGHAVICDAQGEIVEAWGNPDHVTYPRSSAKMIQALPLVETGAARADGLTTEHLALACASHSAAHIHTDRVRDWLTAMGLDDGALLCGPQAPRDRDAKFELIRAGQTPCRYHNNCSGKHCGFLAVSRHLGAGPDYLAIDHPLQVAIKDAFESVTEAESPCWGIDGCSAPNHATSVHAMARAMARFASAQDRSDTRSRAMVNLRAAMMTHPELVAGEDRACTRLMRAAKGRAAVKTGAEGYFIAILPERRMGIALKITDGATRAAECTMAALLARLGVVDDADPQVRAHLNPDITNFAGQATGAMRPAAKLSGRPRA
jgi:L-asparaginase II